ncbi:hypothetical protein F5Y10DRAFT_279500 [Nemania abortiva]|nr:hypothetical protein F5Y10DRAFT_279500 [Nemania abortiva]
MSPLLDRIHPHQAAAGHVVPTLEAIAANNSLRTLRDDRDDPSPYVLPSESGERSDGCPVPRLPEGSPMSEELQAIMERPIDDDELNIIPHIIATDLVPKEIFCHEVKHENERVSEYISDLKPPVFRGQNGVRRRGVIARHNVKRRWQKLGVWNPEWGFGGSGIQPGDSLDRWSWRPRPEGVSDDVNRSYDEAAELAARALRLRQNLRRGERTPMSPWPHLSQDTTAAQDVEFLITRPWLTFQLEVAEEEARRQRLPIQDQDRCPHSPNTQVINWWKERGDLGDELSNVPPHMFWKWRHESPYPEPEDLTPLRNIQDSPLEVAGEMEFTPSEIDELETIELSKPKQPGGSWAVGEGDTSPCVSGRIAENKAHGETAQGHEELVELVFQAPTESFFSGLFPHDVSLQESDTSSELQGDAAYTLAPNRCCSSRQQSQDGTQDPDQSPVPQSSARISSMKSPLESVPSPTSPNKILGTIIVSTASPATAQPPKRKARHTNRRSVSSRAPPKQETEAQPARGRGRPRKDYGQIKTVYLSMV